MAQPSQHDHKRVGCKLHVLNSYTWMVIHNWMTGKVHMITCIWLNITHKRSLTKLQTNQKYYKANKSVHYWSPLHEIHTHTNTHAHSLTHTHTTHASMTFLHKCVAVFCKGAKYLPALLATGGILTLPPQWRAWSLCLPLDKTQPALGSLRVPHVLPPNFIAIRRRLKPRRHDDALSGLPGFMQVSLTWYQQKRRDDVK